MTILLHKSLLKKIGEALDRYERLISNSEEREKMVTANLMSCERARIDVCCDVLVDSLSLDGNTFFIPSAEERKSVFKKLEEYYLKARKLDSNDSGLGNSIDYATLFFSNF